jgi:hypothetical protein
VAPLTPASPTPAPAVETPTPVAPAAPPSGFPPLLGVGLGLIGAGLLLILVFGRRRAR